MAMNIFKNINTTVEKFSVTPGAPRTGTDTCASQLKMDAIKKAKQTEDVRNILDDIEKKSRTSDLNGSVIAGSVNRTRILNAVNNVTAIAKETLLINVIEDIFKGALLLDKEFIVQRESSIHNIIESYVKSNGGFNILETAITHTDSALLREIKSICEEAAKKVTERKIKSVNEVDDPANISFDMTDDEKSDFENNKAKLSTDEISELVKKKVFTVIQDEKQRQANEDALISDIEDELKSDDKVTDETTAKEALNRIIVGKSPVEETTLFNAIFRNAYHEYLTENLAGAQYTIQNDHERTARYNELGDLDETDAATINPDPPDDSIDAKKEIDMDLVLAEAIASYTLMETIYTLRLEDYSYQNIRILTNKLIHPVQESKDNSPERNTFIENRKKFFNIFNDIKDLKNVDDNKEKLEKYRESLSSNDKDYFEGNVKSAINQIEDIMEKNPDTKDKYEDILSWLNDMKDGKTTEE